MHEDQVFRNWYYLYSLPKDRCFNFKHLNALFKYKDPGYFHCYKDNGVVYQRGLVTCIYKWRY